MKTILGPQRMPPLAPFCRRFCAFLTTLSLAFGFGVQSAPGQIIKINFEKPRVPVTIHHPAATGLALQGKKVAFGQISGPCAQQFSDLLIPIFQANGVEVVNREQLSALLTEHKFQVSSSVDPTTAVALGKVLGPSAMIFVTVSRCSVERNLLYEDAGLGRPRMNVSRTQAHFLASVHTVDLATGRELAVQSVETNPKRENRSATGVPEYPGEVEVQDMAVHEGATKAEHLYFPWTETRTVSFMNSKECGLKQAYDLLRAGDTKGALTQSQENVESCKADPKVNHRADAYYNLGVAYMVNDDYDHALTALGESNQLHSDKAVLDAIAECRQAKAGAEAVARNEVSASTAAENARSAEQSRTDQQAKEMLTNDTIIEMVKSGFSADLLIRAIATQPTKFSVTPGDMMALKKAGVPDAVIAAMLDKK
jgi:hypothetical protein